MGCPAQSCGLLLVTTLACARGTEPPPVVTELTIRDSAGIAIVEHPAQFEASLPEWEVDSAPLLDIGGGEDAGQDLHLVRGALRLVDGRIAVANGGSNEIRLYDRTGRHIGAIGRQGQGPGEFAGLGPISLVRGDTILAIDSRLSRFSLFLTSGTFLSSANGRVQLEKGGGAASHRLLDGSLIGLASSSREEQSTDGPIRRDPYLLFRQRPGQGMDTILSTLGPEVYPARVSEGGHEYSATKSLEFGRSTQYVADSGQIFVASSETNQIDVYLPDGRWVRSIRSATPAEAVTEEDRAQRIRDNEASLNRQQAPEQLKAEWRKNAESPRFAERFPFFERLLIGTEGNLWAELPRRTQDEGRRYIVYDTSGRAISRVQCPARMRPYSVGQSEIIGVWRDPDEVQHVRAYTVRGLRSKP